jgi:hypothetical protein
MFENYREMGDAEKASVKAIHRALRAGARSREGNLAWGFVRGFKYKRIERTVRVERLEDGTSVERLPSAGYITHLLGSAIPGFAGIDAKYAWRTRANPAVEAWLRDPSGAIPAPVRERTPFVRAEVA